MHSDLPALAAFVTSVESGSFTAAASRLGLSKSAIAKTIGRLEERLGTRLLDRTTRSLNLTEEGRLYYETARRVIDDIEMTEAALVSRKQTVSGRLRVSLPVTFGRLWVQPVLLGLAQQHPELDLDLSFTDRHVALVEEGIDMAVRLGHPGNSATLSGRRLATQQSVLCASPDYLDRRGTLETIDDLARHDCLLFSRNGQLLPWHLTDAGTGLAQAVTPRPRHIISHGDGLRDAALAGSGLAWLATWLVATDLQVGRLRAIPIPSAPQDMDVHVLWPKSRTLSPRIRASVDALVRTFQPIPPWDQL